jgi:flagellar basal body-associated protein FliL
MAIVVEEEKDRGSIVVLIGWLVVIITIIAAAYMIFFKNPQIIETVGPSSFRQTAQVAKINLNTDVFKDPAFTARQIYVQPIGEGTVGKSNPFLP